MRGRVTKVIERHRFSIAVALCLLLPLLTMYYHGRRGVGLSIAEKAYLTLAGRLQSAVDKAVRAVGDVMDSYVLLVHVKEENLRLQRKNRRLVGEAQKAKLLAQENAKLRRLLGLVKKRSDLLLLPARVVSAHLTSGYRVTRLVLDVRGEQTGVRPDMAVVTYLGLVGRVGSVHGNVADVLLLTDPRSRIGCMVVGKNVIGTVMGNVRSTEDLLRFEVPVSAPVLDEGDAVVTSGHDGVMPRGLEVGYVRNPERRRVMGAVVTYEVVPAADPLADVDIFVVAGTK